MRSLLTEIELDIQELKYLMDAFSREPNEALRAILKRNTLQMRVRLDQILQEIDVMQVFVEEEIESNQTAVVESSSLETLVKEESSVVESIIPISSERIKPVVDLRRSISLNDSFRFSRELFDGDAERLIRVLEQISEMSSYDSAIAFLFSKVNVGKENEAMVDFMELLKKYFN